MGIGLATEKLFIKCLNSYAGVSLINSNKPIFGFIELVLRLFSVTGNR